jgi:hypothetical protein
MLLAEARQKVMDATGNKDVAAIDRAILAAGRSLYVEDPKSPARYEHEKYHNFTPGKSHGGAVRLSDQTITAVLDKAATMLKSAAPVQPEPSKSE